MEIHLEVNQKLRNDYKDACLYVKRKRVTSFKSFRSHGNICNIQDALKYFECLSNTQVKTLTLNDYEFALLTYALKLEEL